MKLSFAVACARELLVCHEGIKMSLPTDRDWIEWGRERVFSGSAKDLELIRESWPKVPNEYRLHWMPFALGISDANFLNYLINLEIVTESQYRSAESRLKSNSSWFEILCEAKLAFYGDCRGHYEHLEILHSVISSHYPQLELDFEKNTLRYGDVSFISKYPGFVPFENMCEDFLRYVRDERRTCWIQQDSLSGDEPIIFAKVAAADRLCRRLELGCTLQIERDSMN